jgi:hypothetical protein
MTTAAPQPGGAPRPEADALAAALLAIAAGAEERDADPRFPTEALDLLECAGALALTVPGADGAVASFAREWALVRAVAAADGSVARILDGHLNAVERLRVAAPEPLRSGELAAVAAGERRLGVWGADPLPGEGPPARLVDGPGGEALVGAKVFCSGAGGLDRALVAARGAEGAPRLVYVDLAERVEVDPSWFRGAGMRASESHRVRFHGARVLARLGGPGELVREPEFGRDAIRTAASWAGLADAAVDAALDELARSGPPGDLAAHAAGVMLAARATIDRWFEGAAARADADPAASLAELSIGLRVAVADASRTILDEAARACGSRPFAAGGRLDRVRRDLELFLLQHRLDPLLARVGRRALEERAR